MIEPIYDYPHGTAPNNCNAITAGAFVPGGVWPGYEGAYLYGDYVCGKLFVLRPDDAGGYTSAEFATQIVSIVAMTFGSYDGTQALYYTKFGSGGQLRRISYTGSANRARPLWHLLTPALARRRSWLALAPRTAATRMATR
jgi:hypothetical protein